MDIAAVKLLICWCFIAVCLSSTASPKVGSAKLAAKPYKQNSTHLHSRLRNHHAQLNTRSDLLHAQASMNCGEFLAPIKKKRDRCLTKSTHEVDICVYFAADFESVVPFLVHYLSLGVSTIWMYNNDDKHAWYKHPGVQCLMSEGAVDIQPWYGENGLFPALDHCFGRRIVDGRANKSMENVWGAVIDIDEMLVLHQDDCIAPFVERVGAGSSHVALRWAFYSPEIPLSDFARTGNLAHLPASHYETIKTASNITDIANEIVLPHDMLLRRAYSNRHVKCVTRHACAGRMTNMHYPAYKNCSHPYQGVDPAGNILTPPSPFSTYIGHTYPVAQLNHYWTTSLADFLRKIHRGKGGSNAHNFNGPRNSGELFKTKGQYWEDTSFHRRYGRHFNDLKRICPVCFDTTLYEL